MKLAVRLTIGIVIIIAILMQIDLGGFAKSLLNLSLTEIFTLFLIIVILHYLTIIKWKIFFIKHTESTNFFFNGPLLGCWSGG